MINGLVVSHLDFDSENDRFFDFVIQNPGRIIKVEELEKHHITKPINKLVNDIGFKNNLREIFFPIANKEKVKFLNPITYDYANEHNLPSLQVNKTS